MHVRRRRTGLSEIGALFTFLVSPRGNFSGEISSTSIHEIQIQLIAPKITVSLSLLSPLASLWHRNPTKLLTPSLPSAELFCSRISPRRKTGGKTLAELLALLNSATTKGITPPEFLRLSFRKREIFFCFFCWLIPLSSKFPRASHQSLCARVGN